jgi:hypothetical protein
MADFLSAALAADASSGAGGAGSLASIISESVLRAGTASSLAGHAITAAEHSRLTALRLCPPPPPHARALAALWARLPVLVRASSRRRALTRRRVSSCA